MSYINYSQMSPEERLAFCRDGKVDEKYIVKNLGGNK